MGITSTTLPAPPLVEPLHQVVAPCAPVTFWHVIVADYLTSLAKTFADVQLTACISHAIFSREEEEEAVYVRTSELWSSCWKGPSAPPEHGAPTASLDHRKAQAAPTHPGRHLDLRAA